MDSELDSLVEPLADPEAEKAQRGRCSEALRSPTLAAGGCGPPPSLTWDRVAPALLLISAKIVTDEHSTELALRRL